MVFSRDTSPANISYGPHTQGCHQKPLLWFFCQYFNTCLCYCFWCQMCLFCVLLRGDFTAELWVLVVHCPCKLKTVAFRLKTQVLIFSQLVGATDVELVVVKRILKNVSHLNVIFVLSTCSNRALDSPFVQGFVDVYWEQLWDISSSRKLLVQILNSISDKIGKGGLFKPFWIQTEKEFHHSKQKSRSYDCNVLYLFLPLLT